MFKTTGGTPLLEIRKGNRPRREAVMKYKTTLVNGGKVMVAFALAHLLITSCLTFADTGEIHNMEQQGMDFEKVIDGLEFPEGPAWNGKGILFFSDCFGATIFKVDQDGSAPFVKASTEPFNFEKTNGLTVSGDGDIYACEFSVGAIIRISPDGLCERYVSEFQGMRIAAFAEVIFYARKGLEAFKQFFLAEQTFCARCSFMTTSMTVAVASKPTSGNALLILIFSAKCTALSQLFCNSRDTRLGKLRLVTTREFMAQQNIIGKEP